MTARAIEETADLRTRVLQERLESGLKSLQIEASGPQQQQLLAFVALLQKWNGVYNLTSVRDPLDMLSVHLLDALSIVDLVDRFSTQALLDVGSGAGIPAIPIAIVRPLVTVHSIDAVAKKIGFQLQVKSILKLTNLHPLHARVEAVTPAPNPAVIVSRAFADLTKMLESIGHLTGDATHVIAMKGKVPVDELAALPAGWHVECIEVFDIPFLGAERCAVVLRRKPSSVH